MSAQLSANQLAKLNHFSISPLYTQCKEGFEPIPPPSTFQESMLETLLQLQKEAYQLQLKADNTEELKQYMEESVNAEEVKGSQMRHTAEMRALQEQQAIEFQENEKKRKARQIVLEKQLKEHEAHLQELQIKGERLAREKQQRESDRLAILQHRQAEYQQKQLLAEQKQLEKQQKAEQRRLQRQEAKKVRDEMQAALLAAAEEYEKALEESLENYMVELLEMDRVARVLNTELETQNAHTGSAEVLKQNVQELVWSVQEESIGLHDELSQVTIQSSEQRLITSQISEQLHMYKEETAMEISQLQIYNNRVKKRLTFLNDRYQQCRKQKAQKKEVGRINSIWEPEQAVMDSKGEVQPPMPPPPPPLLKSRSKRASEQQNQKQEGTKGLQYDLLRAISNVKSIKAGFERQKSEPCLDLMLIPADVQNHQQTLSRALVNARKEELQKQQLLAQQPTSKQIVETKVAVSQIRDGFEKSLSNVLGGQDAEKDGKDAEVKVPVSQIRDGFERQVSGAVGGWEGDKGGKDVGVVKVAVSSIRNGFERQASTVEDVKAVQSITKQFERSSASSVISRNAIKSKLMQFEPHNSHKEAVKRNFSSPEVFKSGNSPFLNQNQKRQSRNATRPNLRIETDRWNDLVKFWNLDN